jgi:hypothetical protein
MLLVNHGPEMLKEQIVQGNQFRSTGPGLFRELPEKVTQPCKYADETVRRCNLLLIFLLDQVEGRSGPEPSDLVFIERMIGKKAVGGTIAVVEYDLQRLPRFK